MKKTIKLVSCEDYVVNLIEDAKPIIVASHILEAIDTYAKLLKQPLTLGMFVPCDSEGNVVIAPDLRLLSESEKKMVNLEYKQALDRVVFEGFEVDFNSSVSVWVKNEDLELRFSKHERQIQFRGSYIETISDLCGYGLKVKMG